VPMAAADAEPRATGFWGASDALHQFCEPRYAISYHFAEFWNSISSAIYVLVGIYALCHRQAREDIAVAVIFSSLIGVGFGSALFHATMLYKYELLDELPMLVYICCCLFAKEEIVMPYVSKTGYRFILLAALLFSTCTYLLLAIYEVFVACFTLLVLMDTALSLTWSARTQPEAVWARNAAIAAIVSAKVLWEVEVQYCSTYPSVWSSETCFSPCRKPRRFGGLRLIPARYVGVRAFCAL